MNKIETVQEYVNYLYSKGLIDVNFTHLQNRDVKEVYTIVHNTWNSVQNDTKLYEIRTGLLLQLEEANLIGIWRKFIMSHQVTNHRTKKLIIFSNDVIANSQNILNTLHSIKEQAKGASYWVFTNHQLQELNIKLNQIIGHDKWDIETRIHSIYGIKVKRLKDGEKLQNRKSWSLIKFYLDMDAQLKSGIVVSDPVKNTWEAVAQILDITMPVKRKTNQCQ